MPSRLLKARYMAEGEALLRETRATRLHYLPGPLTLIAIFLLLLYSDAANREQWPAVPGLTPGFGWINGLSSTVSTYLFYFLLFLTLIAVLWFIVRYLRWISTVYAVTTQRVIVQSGIIGRQVDEIPLLQIRGVDVHQTILQRILGFGTMWVSSETAASGGRDVIGNEAWNGIPKPFEVQRLIESASQSLAQARTPAYR